MPEPFLGEIRIFAGNYAPDGWALCDGQLFPIAQYSALFSLLGTAYGGDGRTTFAVPNLTGCAPLHRGDGPGLTPRTVGEHVGNASVTLTTGEMPVHTHQVVALSGSGSTAESMGSVFAEAQSPPHQPKAELYATTPGVPMNPQSLSAAGGNQPHNNMQPYLGLNFIIALQGEFPIRN